MELVGVQPQQIQTVNRRESSVIEQPSDDTVEIPVLRCAPEPAEEMQQSGNALREADDILLGLHEHTDLRDAIDEFWMAGHPLRYGEHEGCADLDLRTRRAEPRSVVEEPFQSADPRQQAAIIEVRIGNVLQ